MDWKEVNGQQTLVPTDLEAQVLEDVARVVKNALSTVLGVEESGWLPYDPDIPAMVFGGGVFRGVTISIAINVTE